MADPYDDLILPPSVSRRSLQKGGEAGDWFRKVLAEMLETAKTPGKAAQGKLTHKPQGSTFTEEDQFLTDLMADEPRRAALSIAGNVVGTPGTPRGALGAGMSKAGRAALPRVESVGRTAPEGGGAYPGIYKNPKELAREAEAMVAPEHPALKEIFGVNRGDLYDISQGGTRKGNMEPQYFQPGAARGMNYVARGIINPENEARLLEALGTGLKEAPRLREGMLPWYVMDPAYMMLEKEFGPDLAKKYYNRYNTLGPMASPGSAVPTEINRGSAANMMAERGQFPLFDKFAGMAESKRGKKFPDALRDVEGHPYHSTSQAGPMRRYVESGVVDMKSPKVPTYMQASGVPQTGFQTKAAVPDAHYGRGLGAADVRKGKDRGPSLDEAEYKEIGPWYRESIANPLGIEAVPAQGFQWGLYAPQTGVDTLIGAPKLELTAQNMWERAKKLGVDPKKFALDVLSGRQHAQWLLPGAGGAIAAGAMAGGDPWDGLQY